MFNMSLKNENVLSHFSFLIVGIILSNLWIESSLKENITIKENFAVIGIHESLIPEKSDNEKNQRLALTLQKNGLIQCVLGTSTIILKRLEPFPIIETSLNFPFDKISGENKNHYKLAPLKLTKNIPQCQNELFIQYGNEES